MSDGLLRCRICNGRTSLTAGTIFQDTRKPLRTWFLAMWFVTSQKNGVSALGLQRVLGLGSYETAWTWLHKLRRAMVRPGRDGLTGAVEVDEIYVGGAEAGVRGRETEAKAIVAVAAEKTGRGIGRIRLRRIMDVSGDSLIPFVREAVVPGCVVHTDGWSGYSGLAKAGYLHEIVVISRGDELAHEVLPRVHMAASLLKRWLTGTHQGGVQHRHLDYYWTSSPFGLIVGAQRQEGCSFTGSHSRRLQSLRRHIVRSSEPKSRPKSVRSVKGIPIFKKYHDRQPFILRREEYAAWLGSPAAAKELFTTARPGCLIVEKATA